MPSEKVYVVGATGNIGTKIVTDLLARGVPTTIYVRNVEKSRSLFTNSTHLTLVQGDYSDLTAFKASIQGHTRLFVLIADLVHLPRLKAELGEAAYQSGVQQIVDLSSSFSLADRRTTVIGQAHGLAEDHLSALAQKHNRFVVTLLPSRFYTNHKQQTHLIQSTDTIVDSHPSNEKLEYISTDDIADVATLVLTDPVTRHGNRAYLLIGDSVDGATRAAYFSQALGRPIQYKEISPKDSYDLAVKAGVPHDVAFDLAIVDAARPPTNIVPILLGRPHESLESWIRKNKEHFI